MTKPRSDALVFFGATGDLAYKKIFPALHAMARRGKLDLPVIGVAKSGWNLNQLIERARASVREYGTDDAAALDTLISRLRYVDGDYTDPNTVAQLRRELDGATLPTHYLAIPPNMFPTVTDALALAAPPSPRPPSRFRRTCFLPPSPASRARTARRTPASSSRSRSATTSLQP